MEPGRFRWDSANIDHIARHNLEPEDVEEALLDPNGINAAAYNTGSERRYGFIGATETGRILYVLYTERGGELRVVTARDTDASQKRRYRR